MQKIAPFASFSGGAEHVSLSMPQGLPRILLRSLPALRHSKGLGNPNRRLDPRCSILLFNGHGLFTAKTSTRWKSCPISCWSLSFFLYLLTRPAKTKAVRLWNRPHLHCAKIHAEVSRQENAAVFMPSLHPAFQPSLSYALRNCKYLA